LRSGFQQGGRPRPHISFNRMQKLLDAAVSSGLRPVQNGRFRHAASPPGRYVGLTGRQPGVVSDTHPLLVDAIEQKRRLRFLYNGTTRLVEPQCYGIGRTGTELLRAHQLQGGQDREPLFDVSKIASLEVLDQLSELPGPNYKRGDSAIKIIFAQL
jgi:hypothetical protein